MNTTNASSSTSTSMVSKTSSKARMTKLAALAAVAGLGLAAPVASAGPFGTDKVTAIDKVIAIDKPVLSFGRIVVFTGPAVITINPNEAHLLSEYFSINVSTLSIASIMTSPGVRLLPGDSGVSFQTISSADLLSRSMKISSPGSITLQSWDISQKTYVTKTAAIVFPTPAPSTPPHKA